MNIEQKLKEALGDADEFYILEESDRLIAHRLGEREYRLICYLTDCDCQHVTNEGLMEGETVKAAFPDAREINQEEFEQTFRECFKEYYAAEGSDEDESISESQD